MTARTVRRVRAIDGDDDAGDARARVRGDVVVDGVSRDGAGVTARRGRAVASRATRDGEGVSDLAAMDAVIDLMLEAKSEEEVGKIVVENVDVRPEDVDAVRVSKRHRRKAEKTRSWTRGRVHETGGGHGGEDGEHDGGGERELANRGRRGGGSVER